MQSRNPRHRRTGRESSRCYDDLLILVPSPVISLNRAIAVGIRDGPDAGLALLDAVTELAASTSYLPRRLICCRVPAASPMQRPATTRGNRAGTDVREQCPAPSSLLAGL